jgi:hypothetical protein
LKSVAPELLLDEPEDELLFEEPFEDVEVENNGWSTTVELLAHWSDAIRDALLVNTISAHCALRSATARGFELCSTYIVQSFAVLRIGGCKLNGCLGPFFNREARRQCDLGPTDVSGTCLVERHLQADVEVGHVDSESKVDEDEGRTIMKADIEGAST